MAITSLAPQSASVRCAICARPARRGATLCLQCKSAVKRARQVPSVRSELLPHPSAIPDRGSSAGETSALSGGRANARSRSWGAYATLIAFGVAICLIGYFALGELDDNANRGLALHSMPRTAAAPGDAGPSRAPLPSLAIDESVGSESANPVETTGAQASSAMPGPADSPSALKQAKEPPLTPLPTANPLAAAVTPPPAPEVVAAPPPPVVAEPPAPAAPDRWQLLANATSLCERENLLAGLLCKERARLQYCEGHWGTAPQCAGSVATNNNTR